MNPGTPLRVVVLPLCLLLLAPAVVSASPDSERLVDEAIADVQADHTNAALAKLRAASAADPRDARPPFFEGALLNRVGRYEDALARLRESERLGIDHPNFRYELGWALVGVGRWQDAVAALEAYDAATPGRGLTSQLLGRAYVGLGRYEEAATRFTEAMEREPRLRASSLYYLAQVELRRGRRAVAERHVDTLLREQPESPIADALRRQLAEPVTPSMKPWRLGLSIVGGYNDNVIALNRHAPLPSEISTKRSAFARTVFTASYDLHPTERDTVSLGYAFSADVYVDVPSFDMRDHYFYIDYSRPLTPALAFNVRLADEYTQVADLDFRNQASVRPALDYRLTPWAIVEVAYSATWADYLQPGAQVRNRDGWSHTPALTAYVAIPGTRLSARVGYWHEWSETAGNDFDFQSDGVSLGVSHPLVWEIVADLSYTHVFTRYAHRNSLAGEFGFGFRRNDDSDSARAEVSRRITPWLSAFARYEWTNARSNIRVYTYDQSVVSVGINGSF